MKNWKRMKSLDAESLTLYVVDEDGHEIASVRGWAGDPDDSDKNADLIAAAPELLAACKAFLKIFEDGTHCDTRNPYTRPEVKAAIAAIAKAEGK